MCIVKPFDAELAESGPSKPCSYWRPRANREKERMDMALYAIGDLHLHYQSTLKSRRQMTERVWKNHEEKLRRNCEALLRSV